MKTYTRDNSDPRERAEIARRRGKLQQEWDILAEAAHEATSRTERVFYDNKMRSCERRMQDSPRFMRNKGGGFHL